MTKPSKQMQLWWNAPKVDQRLVFDHWIRWQFARCTSDVTNRAQTYATNDQIIVLKWPLDLSFVTYYQVRTFPNVFLSVYSNQIWITSLKTCTRSKIYVSPQPQSSPPKVIYLQFLRTLKRSRAALIHLPKEISTGIYRSSFQHTTTRSLIDLKVSHMVIINFIHEVLLLQWIVYVKN